MTKIKKTFSIFALVVMVALSSLFMFACSGRVDAKKCFSLIDKTITSYKDNTKLFNNGEVFDVQTNFYLSDLKSKDESGNLVNDCENYLAFVSYGLEFIENNYKKLENLETKHNFILINKEIKEMNKAFDEVERKYDSLKSLDSTAKSQIYNGHFARYKFAVKNFIEEVFDSAIILGEYLVEEYGDGIGHADMTIAPFNTFVDYHKLLICKDFENFFIEGADGQTFSNELFASAQSQFENYYKNALNKTELQLSTADALKTKEILETLDADRANVMLSMDKFSLKAFYTAYEGQISSYEKINKYASVYFNNIESYFSNTGSLANFYTYLVSLA